MHIAFLSRTQNESQRGVETFIRELVDHLPKGIEVEILAGKDADSFKKMVSGGYDIVVPFNGGFQSLKASIGRIFGKYKLLIGGHSGIGRDDIWNILIARPNVFVALTDYMAFWARRWGLGVKIVKINNGIDLKKFNPKGEKFGHGLKGKVVLSVGALVWYKFHDRAIEAVSLLDNVSLLVVGSGEEKEKLEKLGREKLGDRFKILKVDFEDMPKVYRGVDLFTLPSWDREAFGLVYLEAMASGLACVGPDDLSRKEIIGDGGVLVDVEDIEKYAKAIDEALNKNWGEKPRLQAEKFSWDKIAQNYQKCFQDLLA